MKRRILKFFIVMFIFLSLISHSTYNIYAFPYYDLKFEKASESIVKGEYERLGDDIKLDEDTEMTMIIDKYYNYTLDKEINKDEEDAISQVIGSNWMEPVNINKEEDIKIDKNTITYIQVRPIYKEIKGTLVRDYQSWNKMKYITIRIPIDLEYRLKINS